MSVSSSTLRKLATLGLDAMQLAGVLDVIADLQENEERRLTAQREKKARQRALSRDKVGTTGGHVPGQDRDSPPPSLDKKAPHTPKELNPPTPASSARTREGFSDFWAKYPNKVGKAAAEASYSKALSRSDHETIMAGLARYAAKTDDRPWCNPATWLNQDRWTDEPASPQARGSPKREETVSDVIARLKTQMAAADEQPEPPLDRNRPPALALFSGERGWDA